MKHLYTKAGLVLWLILLSFLRTNAQDKDSEVLGSAFDFIKELRTRKGDKELRRKPVNFKLDKSGDLNGNIEYFENDQNLEIYSGTIEGEENSRVRIVVKENIVTGTITLREKKRAFTYSTNTSGELVLAETDINKLLCVDYNAAPIKKEKRAIAGPPPTLNPYIQHSNINAPVTIYLDFNGEYVNSSYWGVIDAAPSGMPDDQVMLAWRLVAEDFAPFNVDVTTDRAYYDSKPMNAKHMNIFTTTKTAAPNSGGVAATGSFPSEDFIPSWTFNMNGIDGGPTASHEIGHAFGLLHDGTLIPNNDYYWGHADWCPIMGACYGKQICQWSKGEYQSANRNQDDLAVIAMIENKAGFRMDDFGNSTADASLLNYNKIADNPSGPIGLCNFKGIISKPTDKDVFKFGTNGGTSKIDIMPAEQWAGVPVGNLDIKFDIYNSSGVLMHTYDPAGLESHNTLVLSAGIYYVSVDGTGRGNPLTDGYSDYGSVGEYTFNALIANPITGLTIAGIRYPENGTEFVNPGTIRIKPEVDSPYSINKVEYFDGGVKIGESNATNANHFFDVNNLSAGVHSFTIKAWRDQTLMVNSAVASITVYKNITPAGNSSNKKPGLIYDYYEGSYTALPNFSNLTPVFSGINYGEIDLPSIPVRADNFALRFTGYIRVLNSGFYKLSLSSDDGSKLYFNNQLLINNDGNHAMREMTAKVALVEGYYPVTVEYYDATSLQDIKLSITDVYTGQYVYTEVYHDNIDPLPKTVRLNKLLQGVVYDYNEGTYDLLPNFSSISYKSKGALPDFNLSIQSRSPDNFAVRYTGLIDVEHTGEYKFFIFSDDGSRLYIDDILVVNNDGTHGMLEKSGAVWLWSGKHNIRVEYFEKSASEGLIVSYSGPGVYKKTIPTEKLFRDPLIGEQVAYENYTPPIPWGTILAEKYDQGGETHAYHDNTVGNQFNNFRNDGVDIQKFVVQGVNDYWVSDIQDGEWLEYTVNVTKTGPVNLKVQCSSGLSTSKFHLEKNSVAITPTVSVPPITNGSASQIIVIPNVNFVAGEQVIRVYFDKGGFMFDYISSEDASGTREDIADEASSSEGFNAVTVFPNPFEDHVNLNLTALESVQEIKVYNTSGMPVWMSSVKEISDVVVVPLNELASGIYFIEIRSVDKVLHKTIVKK